MTTPVQAQSLSSLTTLFANPPQYPRNPTHAVRDPLVLYIVRVPGSKDVFLTPLKPTTKASISVEALQSCLYYLHVTTPADEAIKEAVEERRRSEETQNATNAIPIIRKPLPPAPFVNYPPSERPPLPQKVYPYYQPLLNENAPDTQAARFAARGNHLRLNTSTEGSDRNIYRKPVGPRPFQSTSHSADIGVIARKPVSPSPTKASQGLPIVTRKPVSNLVSGSRPSPVDIANRSILEDYGSDVHKLESDENRQHPYMTQTTADAETIVNDSSQRNRGGEGAPNEDVTTITIIRRDPFSGSQWNVGSISYSNSLTNSDSLATAIEIKIDTPGYRRFTRQTDITYLGRSIADADAVKQVIESELASSHTSSPSGRSGYTPFIRKVEAQTPQNYDRTSKHHSQINPDEILKPVKQSFAHPKPNVRPRYAFLSPWQGSCTFNTGMDGRSLKCRHTLPSHSSFDAGSTVSVTELRFNLPWSILKSKDTNLHGNTRGNSSGPTSPNASRPANRDSFRRNLQHFRNKSWTRLSSEVTSDAEHRPKSDSGPSAGLSPSDSDSEERISLRLGKEKAGGGFKGKSAKLGKLIIEDEGLKMCDLVVAATMGVWWQHYVVRLGDTS